MSDSDSRIPVPSDDPEQEALRGERLQKVLAAAGVGSRRECEELIVDGRVEVDRKLVTELGSRVDPLRQEIRVDGQRLHMPKKVYYLVNKPAGIVSTNRDPSGRPRVIDLVRTDERLFTVGRLDKSSEGLILLTNDGELANQLAHPRYGVEKTYLAQVAGHPTAAQLRQLLDGVHLAEGVARVARLRTKKRYKQSTELELVLREGRNREIRRVLAHVGHKVVRLKRIAIGPLRLGDLPAGAHRRLGLDEVRELERAARRGSRLTGKTRSSGKRPAAGQSRGGGQPRAADRNSSGHAGKSKGGRGRMLPAGAGNRAASRSKSPRGKKTTHKANWKKRG